MRVSECVCVCVSDDDEGESEVAGESEGKSDVNSWVGESKSEDKVEDEGRMKNICLYDIACHACYRKLLYIRCWGRHTCIFFWLHRLSLLILHLVRVLA